MSSLSLHIVPPAQFQVGHRLVDEFTSGQSSTTSLASESPPRAPVGAKSRPEQGGQ
ncbi:hypothetical protein [Dictyobacter formicarum]|uniref:hypothetical protein n=1 Tax=Dictyobacter formicarum TaxID=2778368 RepID=UPI00191572A1|nr:hypothetical protein [Dictyobacter formicarum]